MKTDAQLGADVAQELRWTLGDRAPRISVTVADGVVALSGSVDDTVEKRAAGGAVERVCGVRAIKNVIAVRPARQHARPDRPDDLSRSGAARAPRDHGTSRSQVNAHCLSETRHVYSDP